MTRRPPDSFADLAATGDSDDPQHRHGTDLKVVCNQCGTSWSWSPEGPTQCPDCLDHLGEPVPAGPRPLLAAGPTPEQIARAFAERNGSLSYADGRPKMHRHFAVHDVHRDDMCLNPGSRRRVYVFDGEDLDAHEAHIAARVRAATLAEFGWVE